MDERLKELQKDVALKGFRPGKVPSGVIKSQFVNLYGEVVDKILRETYQAIDEKNKSRWSTKNRLKAVWRRKRFKL